MHLIGMARLGRDAEVRYLADGTAVAGLALAFNYGKKDGEGKRPTQWVDASLWGERAEKLVEYLVKGQQVCVVLSEPHVETYEKKDGTLGTSLRARVDSLEFGARPEGASAAPAQTKPEPAKTQASSAKRNSNADFDDDIPF